MDFEQKIKQQWKDASSRYYDANRVQIAQRRKELRDAKKQGIQLPKKQRAMSPPPPYTERETKRVVIVKNKNGKNSIRHPIDEAKALQFLEKLDSEGNIRANKDSAKMLFRLTGSKDIYKDIMNFDKTKEIILHGRQIKKPTEEYSLSAKLKMIQFITNIIKTADMQIPDATIQKWNGLWNDLVKRNDDHQANKIHNPKYAVPLYSKKMAEAKDKFGENSKEYFLFVLYNEATFRDNFDEIYVTKGASDKDNYMDISNPNNVRVILNEYKMKKKYKTIDVDFTPSSSQYIVKWLKDNNIGIGETVFKGKQSRFIGEMLRKLGITHGAVNTMRHMKDTEVYNDTNTTFEQKVELARRMGHSLRMARDYVRRIQNDTT